MDPDVMEGRRRPDLSVTIASFNTCAVLDRCIASLHAHRGSLDMEVIVVDNGSSDDSARMVAGRWPGVRLIVNDRNRYLTGAQNQAIAAAGGRYLLILNSDMEVVDGTLPSMVEWMDAHPLTGAASCVEVLHGRPKAPLLFQTPREAILRRTWLRRLSPSRPDHFVNPAHESGQVEAEVISDAFMVVRREALLGIGGFDESLKLYYTEDDICMRLHRAGWQVHFVASATVIHIGDGSHSVNTVGRLRILWINYRDTWRYFHKHFGPAAGLVVYAVFLAQFALHDAPRALKKRMSGLLRNRPKPREVS
ncbi:MAG TPA: glycosyltransferase family 2 protein [Candidatus Polarisedimenticolia bacterium]|jgi:hypothetical protein